MHACRISEVEGVVFPNFDEEEASETTVDDNEVLRCQFNLLPPRN